MSNESRTSTLAEICEDRMPDEVWRIVAGWPDYAVSDQGRVMLAIAKGSGTWPGKVLKPTADTHGYLQVYLVGDGGRKKFSVHRLVCKAFHGAQPSDKREVGHINHVKTDNRAENLRWCSRLENEADKVAAGRQARGEAGGTAKLTDADVLAIRAIKGVSQAEIGMRFGVSPQLISSIRNRSRWSHL